MYYLDIADAFAAAKQHDIEVDDLQQTIEEAMHELGTRLEQRFPSAELKSADIMEPEFAEASLGFVVSKTGDRDAREEARTFLEEYDPTGGD